MPNLLWNFKQAFFPKPSIAHDSDSGFHNDLNYDSFIRLNSYSDQSTVCIIPTRGKVDARVVNSWFKLMTPTNQKFVRLMVQGGEVADAYNTAIIGALNHPGIGKYKYLLTMEDDNLPPPDGFLKLMRSMLEAEKKGENLWAVSGLYWTKGEQEGVPIAFGDVRKKEFNLDYIEFKKEGVTPCCVIPQGFTLFKMDIFRKLPYPWFKTLDVYDPTAPAFNQGISITQDSYFFENCYNAGLRFGVRADVRVGHLDMETGQVW